MHLVTINVYQRTFHIRYGDATGTCFTVDLDGKQYIITAKHVIQGLGQEGALLFSHKREWQEVRVRMIGESPPSVDVAVFTAENIRLSPNFPLPATSNGLVLAQDVHFLGFPYGMSTELGPMNRDFPLAFVKRAIVSSMYKDDGGIHRMFLDGHNNPGFSGGPIVWTKRGKNDYSVAGIVSGFQFTHEPVFAGADVTPLSFRYNTGIIVAYGIEHALELIRANPTGISLT